MGARVAKKTSGRRSDKTKSTASEVQDVPVSDVVEDAVVVAEDTVDENVADTVELADDASEDQPAIEEEELVVQEDQPEPAEEDPVNKSEETDTYTSTEPQNAAPVQKGNSFVPLVLGGAVAGIIGYGIGTYQSGQTANDLRTLIGGQSDQIVALEDKLADLAERPDDTGLADSIAAVEGSVSELTGRIDTDLAALDERLIVVERQPSADGTLQETAIAAFEADITELRDQISAQQDELRGLLSETRQEAEAIETSAIASAKAAMARTSLAVIQGSLESGAPLGAALTDLEGSLETALPDALTNARDGVTTLASLQESFPAAARDALATARSEGASGEDAGGLGGFLRNQFDVRSVEPQEGDSVDAVLSRAEAALKEGRLNDTLAEMAALPEVARAPLTDWTAQAEQRAAALDATAGLASQLNVN